MLIQIEREDRQTVRSPKLAAHISARKYMRYYAGYSDSFVEDMLRTLRDQADLSLILDPWNGSGTTTSVASHLGIASVGYDINPVALILSKANLLKSNVAASIVPLAAEILESANRTGAELSADPLSTWFGPKTIRSIRRIERTVERTLVAGDVEYEPQYSSYSSLAAAFYVILFRMVRDLVQGCIPSNPTWIKSPEGRRIGVSDSEVRKAFSLAAKRFADSLSSPHQYRLDDRKIDQGTDAYTPPIIELSGSTKLPLQPDSVSGIISSPPYCTRIDYVKATLPELAILGVNQQAIRKLRDQMIGTPTMQSQIDRSDLRATFGTLAAETVEAVSSHPSHASSTYYRKYYEQYFSGMAKSLTELDRVRTRSANAVLVVQDSYYKDLHIDLPEIIGDIALTCGWNAYKRIDFSVTRTMAAINTKSRLYRDSFDATESAVILE